MDLSGTGMTAAPAPYTPQAAALPSASVLSSINPQLLAQASILADVMNTGGRDAQGIASAFQSIQPNQTATNNRTALQSLAGFQQQLANQGGTGGLGGSVKRLVSDIPILGSMTGPGQFEQNRQSTAATIAQATGMSPQAALNYLPNFGEDPMSAQSKLQTLQTMLSSGYAGALNPGQLTMPGQQSFGGIGNTLPGINAGTGGKVVSALTGMGGGTSDTAGLAGDVAKMGTSLAADVPEALATTAAF